MDGTGLLMAKETMSKKPFRGPPPRPRPTPAKPPISEARLKELIQARQWSELLVELADLEKRGPLSPMLQNLRGVALKNVGRIDAARAAWTTLLERVPNFAPALANLGNLALTQRDGTEALYHLEKLLVLKPDDPEAYRLAANACAYLAQPLKGLDYSRRAAELAPNDAMAWFSLSASYYNNGQDDEALATLRKAMALPQPPDMVVRCRLARARILKRLRDLTGAEADLAAVLELDPDNAEALWTLGGLHFDRKNIDEANKLLRRAYQLAPTDPQIAGRLITSLAVTRGEQEAPCLDEAHNVTANLIDSGQHTRTPQIWTDLQMVLMRTVDLPRLDKLGERSALLSQWVQMRSIASLHGQLSRVVDQQDRFELLEAHRQWGQEIESRANTTPLPPRRPRGPRSKIRVAVLSSDLRHHPVSYFAQPWIELHDRQNFELFCYSFYPGAADKVQEHFAANVASFQVMAEASDRVVAEQIANDAPDILFELAGATQYHRLEALAWKPAPIQVSWVGYPHSVGLSSIDYILLDPYIQPDDPALLLEKPFTMPHSWVSLGPIGFFDLPIERDIPEIRTGRLTFGTMNNPYKYTRQTFDLWADVLHACPDSRFLFVRPEGASQAFRRHIEQQFATRGIPAHRLAYEAVRGKHMPHYNAIDIALDTAPHVGGTTTLETLWMGVPVVTLIGSAFFERLSYSNITNAGLPDLCTRSPDAYVAAAIGLAADRPRRQHLRHALRLMMLNGPLGNREAWVRALEARIKMVVGA